MTAEVEQAMPRSQEAERAVIGAVLRENTALDDIRALVGAGDFYEDAHQKLFALIAELVDAGKVADMVTVGEELVRQGEVDNIGGLPYLFKLWETTPTAANAVYYAEIVRDRSIKRKLIRAAQTILGDTLGQRGAGDDLLEEAQHALSLLAESKSADDPVHVSVAASEARDRIDQRQAGNGEGITGISTGLLDLDNMTAGLQDGELVLIAARPSTGKTALCCSLVLHASVALPTPEPSLFVSLEQRRPDLFERLACNLGRINYKRMRHGTMTLEDIVAFNDATTVINQAPLWIDHAPNQSLSEIKSKARQWKRKHGLRLLVVDYLQLMRPDSGPRVNREQQVAEQLKGLKWLAQELSIPVVLLAQLNRASVSENRRPRLHDIRESGGAEQDGDLIILLHLEPEIGEPGQVANTKYVTAIVAKQRNGETGDVRLVTRFDQMRFENAAREVQIYRTPFDAGE